MEKTKIVGGNKEVGEYTLHQMLGSGSYGKVYKAIHKPTGKIYALKIILKKKLDENPFLEAYFWVEKEIMELINHENVVQLHKHIETDSKHYLAMDFCNQGDFEDYMENNNLETIEESKAIEFIRQLAEAFKELRKRKILHRDLKLENVFLHNDTVKLGDFGVAKMGENTGSTCVGTPLTQAPEVMEAEENDLDYDSKSDIWSFGCVFYKMLFGKYPFTGSTVAAILKEIKQKADGKMKYPKKISSDSQDFLDRIFITKPKNRMKWSELFKHKIFKSNIDFDRKEKSPGLFRKLTGRANSISGKKKKDDDDFSEIDNAIPIPLQIPDKYLYNFREQPNKERRAPIDIRYKERSNSRGYQRYVHVSNRNLDEAKALPEETEKRIEENKKQKGFFEFIKKQFLPKKQEKPKLSTGQRFEQPSWAAQ